MKIALVNSEYPSPSGADHGGIATYTYTLANLLANHGHTVHLLTRSGVHSDELVPDVHIHTLTPIHTTQLWYRLTRRILRKNPITWEKAFGLSVKQTLNLITSRDGLDIVDFPEYGALGMYVSEHSLIPSVVTLHTPSQLVDKLNGAMPSPYRRTMYRLEKKSILKATACKSPSKALKDYACTTMQIPESAIALLKNPFNYQNITSIYCTKEPSVKPRFDILFSGRLEYRKGAEIILKSIKKILAISDTIQITIAGETDIPNHQNYRAAIERILSTEERLRVWFPGAIMHKKLLPLYKNSSLFLFPSLFENAPYALIEAMACGMAVVALAAGGTTELIHHGENGMLFTTDNQDEPVASIASLFKDPERAHLLGTNAATTMAQQFDPESTVASYISFYQSVIDKHNKS